MQKEIKTVHIIGLGAVGATYGSILYDYNKQSVRVIVDENRYEKYKNGTIVNGKNYSFDLEVPGPNSKKAELIIIAVKSHNLIESINTIAPLVGEDTIILSLLNGITSEENLSMAFG